MKDYPFTEAQPALEKIVRTTGVGAGDAFYAAGSSSRGWENEEVGLEGTYALCQLAPLSPLLFRADSTALLQLDVVPVTPGAAFPTRCVLTLAAAGQRLDELSMRDVVLKDWAMPAAGVACQLCLPLRVLYGVQQALEVPEGQPLYLGLRFLGSVDGAARHRIAQVCLSYTNFSLPGKATATRPPPEAREEWPEEEVEVSATESEDDLLLSSPPPRREGTLPRAEERHAAAPKGQRKTPGEAALPPSSERARVIIVDPDEGDEQEKEHEVAPRAHRPRSTAAAPPPVPAAPFDTEALLRTYMPVYCREQDILALACTTLGVSRQACWEAAVAPVAKRGPSTATVASSGSSRSANGVSSSEEREPSSRRRYSAPAPAAAHGLWARQAPPSSSTGGIAVAQRWHAPEPPPGSSATTLWKAPAHTAQDSQRRPSASSRYVPKVRLAAAPAPVPAPLRDCTNTVWPASHGGVKKPNCVAVQEDQLPTPPSATVLSAPPPPPSSSTEDPARALFAAEKPPLPAREQVVRQVPTPARASPCSATFTVNKHHVSRRGTSERLLLVDRSAADGSLLVAMQRPGDALGDSANCLRVTRDDWLEIRTGMEAYESSYIHQRKVHTPACCLVLLCNHQLITAVEMRSEAEVRLAKSLMSATVVI